MGININKTYIIMSRNSGKVLDVPGASKDNSVKIVQFKLQNSENQKWQFIQLSEPDAGQKVYKIVSVNSGKVLDVPGASKDNSVKIVQYEWTNSENQKWIVTPEWTDSDCDTYTIQNKNSWKMLDVAGGSLDDGVNVVQYDSDNELNQKWIITPVL